MKLLTDQEQRSESHFIDFNTSKLIERDLKTQVEILAIERQNEIINAAEWRKKRNLPPRKDPASLEYLNPNTKSNQRAAEPSPAADPKPTAPPPQKKDKPKNELTAAARTACEDTIVRITRRVTGDARNLAKHPAKLTNWLDSQAQDHRDVFIRMIRPAAELIAEVTQWDVMAVCHACSGLYLTLLVSSLNPLTEPPHLASNLEASVNQVCSDFEQTICAKLLNTFIGSEPDAPAHQTAA
jgi:hypothetical protein